MKLELEGVEVDRHIAAVHLLVSLGYAFGKTGWKETDPVVSKASHKVKTSDFFFSELAIKNTVLAPQDISKADGMLQADIENLRQRTDEIEKTLTHSFGAWARDSTTMPAFEKTVKRGIEQELRRATEPGGSLYGKLK